MDVSKRRVVILGKTGTGKSSLANTIFGEEEFPTNHLPNSEIKKCQAKTKSIHGRSITLIDTPGFFNTDLSEEAMKPEIVSCIIECAPGPHAFLIVLDVERFTEHKKAVIAKIQEYFSEEVYNYATVVFTHGDLLQEEQTIEDFYQENKHLRDLVKKCGGRCHVVDNRYWKKENPSDEYRSNQYQVAELLKTIDKMVEEKNRSYYTNKVLEVVEEKIQQEEENIRLLPGNIPEEEIREQAKASVFRRISIRLAGVVLGALFGVALSVGIVLTSLVEAIKVVAPKIKEAAEATTAAKTAVATAAGVAAAGRTALEGGTDVGGGVTAVGGVAKASAIGPAVTVGVAAAVGVPAAIGAMMGGVEGYNAAEGADTESEAMRRAVKNVYEGADCILNHSKDFVKKCLDLNK